MQKPTIVERSPIKIIRIEVRTNNTDETSGKGKIGGQWERFYKEGIEAKIPNRAQPDTIIAVYTDYEKDATADYSFVLGAEVKTFDEVPNSMVAKTLPAAKYAVFTSRRGPIPDIIFEIWKYIWNLKPGELGSNRAYLGDFEVYDARSKDPKNTQVDVFLSIK